MRIIYLFLLFTCISVSLFARNANVSELKDQDSSFVFEFIPSGLHFQPLKGNNQEARLGLLYYTETSNLKVDIGNNIDLIGFSFPGFKGRFTMGIEFMAYAYSTSYKGNRLQIDAVDGFFGGNGTFSKELENSRLFIRARIIHNSAHFVDGHYDLSLKSWINNQEPIPFTRDFGEILVAHDLAKKNYNLRYYAGGAYSTLIRPMDQKKYSLSAGTEFALENMFGKFFGKDENIFAAWHFELKGIPEYIGNNNLQLGLKFGQWRGKGLVFYLDYFSGSNMFSEYYKNRINRFGIGFNVDF